MARKRRGIRAHPIDEAAKPCPGLNDSPAGLAVWIVEKSWAWSDCDGDVESRFTRDELLTNVMIYWVTQSIGTSFLTYFDYANAGAMTWMTQGLKNWAGSSAVPRLSRFFRPTSDTLRASGPSAFLMFSAGPRCREEGTLQRWKRRNYSRQTFGSGFASFGKLLLGAGWQAIAHRSRKSHAAVTSDVCAGACPMRQRARETSSARTVMQ